MGVDIADVRDRSRSLHANWWRWRPTVEVIRSLGLFDEDRLDHLSNGIGKFTEAEAQQIANALEQQVLPGVHQGQRVLLDGTVSNQPDNGIFYRTSEEQHRNYSADRDWLVQFIAFCKASGGLYVS